MVKTPRVLAGGRVSAQACYPATRRLDDPWVSFKKVRDQFTFRNSEVAAISVRQTQYDLIATPPRLFNCHPDSEDCTVTKPLFPSLRGNKCLIFSMHIPEYTDRGVYVASIMESTFASSTNSSNEFLIDSFLPILAVAPPSFMGGFKPWVCQNILSISINSLVGEFRRGIIPMLMARYLQLRHFEEYTYSMMRFYSPFTLGLSHFTHITPLLDNLRRCWRARRGLEVFLQTCFTLSQLEQLKAIPFTSNLDELNFFMHQFNFSPSSKRYFSEWLQRRIKRRQKQPENYSMNS